MVTVTIFYYLPGDALNLRHGVRVPNLQNLKPPHHPPHMLIKKLNLAINHPQGFKDAMPFLPARSKGFQEFSVTADILTINVNSIFFHISVIIPVMASVLKFVS